MAWAIPSGPFQVGHPSASEYFFVDLMLHSGVPIMLFIVFGLNCLLGSFSIFFIIISSSMQLGQVAAVMHWPENYRSSECLALCVSIL